MATPRNLTEADVVAISEAYGEPDWLRDLRQEAFKRFSDLEWPDNRVEEWRYTDPRRFDLDRPIRTEAGSVPPVTAGITATVTDGGGSVRIVDGAVVEATVSAEGAERGVVVTDLATAAREHESVVRAALGAGVGADEKFDALNLAAFTGGAFVSVPADVEFTQPITVTVQVAEGAAVLPRVLVVAGAHSKATVYVDHAGDAPSTVVEVIEVVAGEGSKVRVVTAQDWGSSVDHIGTHRALVRDNADVRHLEVTLGGRTVYLRPDLELAHPGGSGELLGVYFGSEEQRFEHRSLIHHNASQTSSDLVYKGALQGTSRATFFGNILIEPHAKATSSDQTNRNLILTDGAKADSIPFLEINNSDVVRCGHHSSVGQVDEEQLFYLESRGISREEAARLLVFGFFAEVLERVDLPGVREVVLEEIEREIRSGPTTFMNPKKGRRGDAV
jgi:Fe-S cluster assembly protein SufD